MSHISAKNGYKSLEERLNRFPQGAPPSKTLYKILAMLFTEKEAELLRQQYREVNNDDMEALKLQMQLRDKIKLRTGDK